MPISSPVVWDNSRMRDDIAMTTGNSQVAGSLDITDLGNDVYQIDTRMAGYQGIPAGYLIRSSRPCLVETGTSTSAPVVRAALASLGIGPDDLATVVVTHIHLDHAGGVGDIASMFGAAQGAREGTCARRPRRRTSTSRSRSRRSRSSPRLTRPGCCSATTGR
jgi:glyoxylase-like metal-dependent hydrolase (beta-lactamase superfamily II)